MQSFIIKMILNTMTSQNWQFFFVAFHGVTEDHHHYPLMDVSFYQGALRSFVV